MNFEEDLKKKIPTMLKIPELAKLSIPIGIDDGQVYQLSETIVEGKLTQVTLTISLMPNELRTVILKDLDRYQEMITSGFVAKRGVLRFSHGKYFLHIPFQKKAMKKRDTSIIAAVDLGLKTFATLSIFDKKKEIDRRFLDQKNMGGSKNSWWSNPEPLIVKGKLVEHRYEAKKQQSIRMSSKYGSVRKWHSGSKEKTSWHKIQNLHDELIHQIATRTISLLLHHNASRLILEDLRWSKHSKKSTVGFFLSSQQIHWFFSQVQKLMENMCLRYGIVVEYVNPRNSSKECWKCGKIGNRSKKVFICTSKSCIRYQIDSDLNAARNLILRSKKYRRLVRP